MTGWDHCRDVTLGVPVASRCTPSVTAVSGTYLARPMAASRCTGRGHDEALDLVGALVDLGDLSPGRGDLAIYRENSR
jgi:hypothetical protein